MPLENEAINPIDENNFQDGQNQLIPNFPVELQSIDPNSFKFTPGQMTIKNAMPIQLEKESGEKPGFFKTFGHSVATYNELVNAGKFVANTWEQLHPLDDPADPDWRPDTLESINGYSQRYWPYIWDASSPKDQSARQQYVRELMKDEAYYANGSMLANIAGGIVGGITSPSTWLIPMSAGVKYAKFSQQLVKNVARAAPGLATSAIATEGMVQAGDVGGNMQDWVVNSFRDIVYGSAFIGGGALIGKALNSGHVWEMRKTLNHAFKGVNMDYVTNEAGEIIGGRAKAAPGFNLSAAQVEEAQAYIDSSFAQTGLFKIPYVGKVITDLSGNRLLGSPIVRGLSSPYIAVRGFIDRIASHSVETANPEASAEQLAAGRVKMDSAEDMLQITRAKATAFSSALRGLFYEANGLGRKDTMFNALKDIKQTITQDKRYSMDEFGKAVRNVIYTGETHATPQVNEAAKLTMDFVNHIGKEYTDAHGWEEGFLNPRTSLNYLMQNYNLNQIRARSDEFVKLVADGYKEQDKVIAELLSPIDSAQAHLKQLQEAMKDPEFKETRALANEIAAAKGAIKSERESLIKKLQDTPEYHILLEDRVLLDSQESTQLREILSQRTELENQMEEAKAALISQKATLSRLNQNIQKNVREETRAKNLKKIKEQEKRIEDAELRIRQLEDGLETERLNLIDRAESGQIPRKFYVVEPEAHAIHFRDPDAMPKLRKAFDSDHGRLQEANALKETILGNSAEDINNAVLNGYTRPMSQPSSTMRRTVMLPSKIFNDANFLDNDLGKAVYSYANTMGRHTAFKKAFRGPQATEGIEGILKALKQEKDKKEAKILEKNPSKERAKELAKHEKEFEKERQFIKDVHDVYWGKVGTAKQRQISQTLKNFAASTMLGGVPLSQITDLGAIMLKNGLYPFFMQGLRPMLKSMNGLIKSEEFEAMRQNAAHAYVAIQHISSGYQAKFMNSQAGDIPQYGRIGSTIETAAHISGNLYGTNAIENLNQTMVANIFQSEVMKACFDHIEGKATAAQYRKMGRYGIDLKRDAQTFVENYRGANGWEISGGYQSMYYNWADKAAVERMSSSIYRAVYDSVVQRGMFSSPLWTNNPILGLLFTFHGWAYGAFTRYTIPAMQRPDAEAALGMGIMFGLGLLEEPLRQWTNGKEVNLDDDHLFGKALDNSGVLSAWTDMFNTMNIIMNNELIPGMTSERRRDITRWGALAGPLGSQLDTAFELLTHLWTGQISQRDLKQSARLLPFANHLLLRRLSKDWIEGTSLPEKTSEAERWPWWQSLNEQ